MRIALLSTSFLPNVGGAEFVMNHLAHQWGRMGHEVCVFNPMTDQRPTPEAPFSVRRFRVLPGTTRFGFHHFPHLPYTVRDLERLFAAFKPDLTSAHFGYPAGLWLARMRPIPRFLVTCHGMEITPLEWGYRKQFGIDDLLVEALNASIGAIALSTHVHRLMLELGVDPAKVLDIPNGVDVDRFQKPVDFDMRRAFGMPGDAVVIVSLGRFHPQKAFDVGLKAFAKVAARAPRAYFLILGRGVDQLRPLVAELGLERRVVLREPLGGDALIGAYQQSDIFFSSSIYEVLSLVLLEAMAAGLPAVATRLSGSEDMVVDGKTGFLVEMGQIDEMAEALYRLVMDEGMRVEMRTAALARIQEYRWERIARLYLDQA